MIYRTHQIITQNYHSMYSARKLNHKECTPTAFTPTALNNKNIYTNVKRTKNKNQNKKHTFSK